MKLFIDDERFPIDDNWVVVRTSDEAIDFIKKNGIPGYISFDHDLGDDDDSIKIVNFMIDYVLDGHGVFPVDFDYYVHSQNPTGKRNIEGKLDGFLKHIRCNGETNE